VLALVLHPYADGREPARRVEGGLLEERPRLLRKDTARGHRVIELAARFEF